MLKLTVEEFDKLLKSEDWKREEIQEELSVSKDGFHQGLGRKVSKIMHKGELITLTYTEYYSYDQNNIDSIDISICEESINFFNKDWDWDWEEVLDLEGCIIIDEDKKLKNGELENYDLEYYFDIHTDLKNNSEPSPFDTIKYIFDFTLKGKPEKISYCNITGNCRKIN